MSVHNWSGVNLSESYCLRCGRDARDGVNAECRPARREGHSALHLDSRGGLKVVDPHPSSSAFRSLFSNRYGDDKLRQADHGEVYWRATYDSELSTWNYRGEADFEAIMAIQTNRMTASAECYAAGVAEASRVVQALDDLPENPLR